MGSESKGFGAASREDARPQGQAGVGATPLEDGYKSAGWELRYDELHAPGGPMSGPWTWEIHDYSMATLCGAGEDAITGHIMSVGPCEACASRAKEAGRDWKWGRCQTPSLENARLMAAAPVLLEAVERAIRHAINIGIDEAESGYLRQLTGARDLAKAKPRVQQAWSGGAEAIADCETNNKSQPSNGRAEAGTP